MAIAIDQLSLGTNQASGSATTITLTTTATVAANGFIVLTIGNWDSTPTLSTVTGGGLSWTIDKQARSVASPTNPNTSIVSAQAPSGLASSTVLTATFSATTNARTIAGCSFTGVATSSPVDATTGPDAWNGVQPWTTASLAISAGSLMICCAWQETGDVRNTPTSPAVENTDFGTAASMGQITQHRIESSAGSYTLAGNWASTTAGKVNTVAYLAAAGPAGPDPDIPFWTSDVPGPGLYGPGAADGALDGLG